MVSAYPPEAEYDTSIYEAASGGANKFEHGFYRLTGLGATFRDARMEWDGGLRTADGGGYGVQCLSRLRFKVAQEYEKYPPSFSDMLL